MRLERQAIRAALLGLSLAALPAQAQVPPDLAPYLDRFERADAAGNDAAIIADGEAALTVLRKLAPPWNARLIELLAQLGRAQARQGNDARAEALHREALGHREALIGAAHVDTLQSRFDLGGALMNLGRYAESEAVLAEAVVRGRAAWGIREPIVQDVMDLRASALRLLGRHAEAERIYREVLAERRAQFGPRHRSTMVTLNNLGLVLLQMGRGDEAVTSLREAGDVAEEIFGRRHQAMVTLLANLGAALQATGALGEAEQALREAAEIARAVLGPRHRVTLIAIGNLGNVLSTIGRFGDAERTLREALRLHREVQGDAHPETLVAINNLATLYRMQGRNAEAEPLLREAQVAHRAVLGANHPETLRMLDNLAGALQELGRLEEAERVFREVVAGRRATLGSAHPDTALSINNLATLLFQRSRFAEAEALAREAEAAILAQFGPRHPDALAARDNLAFLLGAIGRREEAAAMQAELAPVVEEILGAAHPRALVMHIGRAGNLAALGRLDEAAFVLRASGQARRARLGTELHASDSAAARRSLLLGERAFHDSVLSLALLHGAGAEPAAMAAFASLGLKGVQAEEDAHLARLLRQGAEPEVRALAAALVQARSRLAQLHHTRADQATLRAALLRIEAAEAELGRLGHAVGVARRGAFDAVAAVRARLAPGEAVLELREYQRANFASSSAAESRWAGVLVTREQLRVLDLGTGEELAPLIAALREDPLAPEAARAVFDRLIAPALPGIDRLYLTPDGALQVLPFAALMAPDGRRLAEVIDLRLLLTGRDLLQAAPPRPARGLLALGGVDFDAAGGASAAPTLLAELAAGDGLRSATAGALAQGFRFLPGSAREVAEIAALYRAARPDEAVELLTGAAASEAALANRPAPRVLHLATHGFYLPGSAAEERPLLLSGIALAGANRALAATGQDGILYAIEAQDLDLEGTELVVLSACETAQGQVEYGEGVAGLVRALRTAGARHVLATLRPVEDQAALAFMRRFYRHYLAQPVPDPAAALRAAQIEAMREGGDAGGPDRGLGRPGASGDAVWAQFVLFGG